METSYTRNKRWNLISLFRFFPVKLNSLSRPTTRRTTKAKGNKKTQPNKLRQESANNKRPTSNEKRKGK